MIETKKSLTVAQHSCAAKYLRHLQSREILRVSVHPDAQAAAWSLVERGLAVLAGVHTACRGCGVPVVVLRRAPRTGS